MHVDELLTARYLDPGRDRLGASRWDEAAARDARLGRAEAIELGLDAAAQERQAPAGAPAAPE